MYTVLCGMHVPMEMIYDEENFKAVHHNDDRFRTQPHNTMQTQYPKLFRNYSFGVMHFVNVPSITSYLFATNLKTTFGFNEQSLCKYILKCKIYVSYFSYNRFVRVIAHNINTLN